MYDHLVAEISKTLPSTEYYSLILVHSADIISEVGKTSRSKVAIDLGMSSPKFSNLYPLLLAYNEEQSHADI